MAENQDTPFVLVFTRPELAESADAFLRRCFETAHYDTDLTEQKSEYLQYLAHVAYCILTPDIKETDEEENNDA